MRPDKQDDAGPGKTKRPSPWRYAGLGTELAAGIAGFTLVGLWVDRRFGTGNAGVITGAVVGAVGAFCHLIRRSLEMAKEQGLTDSGRKKKYGDHGDNQRTD